MLRIYGILILFSGLTVCFGSNHSVCHKDHSHHYLHHFHFLAFWIIKLKIIVIIGSIWGTAIIVGKIIAAFKAIEYLKAKKSHPHVVYANPHHDKYLDSPPYHGSYEKSMDAPPYMPSPPKDYGPNDPSNRIFKNAMYDENNYLKTYATLPQGSIGRSYLPKSDSPLDNLSLFFRTIKRMNLTEMVFKEMNLETASCKRKFVCEADFNIKQSVIVQTIFNLFVDNCYKKYRCKERITSIGDCVKMNPKCPDKLLNPVNDT